MGFYQIRPEPIFVLIPSSSSLGFAAPYVCRMVRKMGVRILGGIVVPPHSGNEGGMYEAKNKETTVEEGKGWVARSRMVVWFLSPTWEVSRVATRTSLDEEGRAKVEA